MSETPANSTPRFVKNVIAKAKTPEVMEMFIYAALVKYAEEIAEVPKEDIDLKMEFGTQWHECAIELLSKIDARFPGRDDANTKH